MIADPCDEQGNTLPAGTLPPHNATPDVPEAESWHPFGSRAEFDMADFHFTEAQHSEPEINRSLDILAAHLLEHGAEPRWNNAKELYTTIDEIQAGDAPWQVVKIRYNGPRPDNGPAPKWMDETYELCTRDSRKVLHNQLATTDFKDQFTPSPYRHFDANGTRVFSNLMSGDWAWKQAVSFQYNSIDTGLTLSLRHCQDIIVRDDPTTDGCMYVPVIGGSDKTTVSVSTGHQEYHPVYESPGVITNSARRAHGNGVLPVAMLPIPKSQLFFIP